MAGKWDISGWGEAQGQIRMVVEFLRRNKDRLSKAEVIDEIIRPVHGIGRGHTPGPQTEPREQKEKEYERESWPRGVARDIVGEAVSATKRLPCDEQQVLLREIARWALWHLPNSSYEARKIAKWLDIEDTRQPHPHNAPPKRD
jgi:hypothetical protein